jgi:murein DD-endopeptidase MepM/ murein hydrolase activator NlpD
MRAAVILLLAGALAGCIPPGRPMQQAPADADPASGEDPYLNPEMQTLFDEQPVWEMRPVEASAAPAVGGDYVVVAGDTLRGIGERTGAGSEAIARANNLVAPFLIQPGQRLIIPAGLYHRVGAGETGIAIARAYGVNWQDIIARNALTEPFVLRIGQRLALPPGAAKVPTPALSDPTAPIDPLESRAAAFKLDIDTIVTGGEPAIDPAAQAAAADPAPIRPLAPTVAVAEPKAFTGNFLWPASGKTVARFGPAGEGNINQGIDIAVVQRADVRASSDGVVAFVGDDVANYGGLILVRHGDGWITAYGRVSQALVTRGQKVSRGQAIGYAGTGTAPRLFFQMRKNRIPVDPLKQLPPR